MTDDELAARIGPARDRTNAERTLNDNFQRMLLFPSMGDDPEAIEEQLRGSTDRIRRFLETELAYEAEMRRRGLAS